MVLQQSIGETIFENIPVISHILLGVEMYQALFYSGSIVSAMSFIPELTFCIVFTIPVAMGILPSKDMPALAKGVLAGIVTIPLGILAGGLVAGFPIGMVLRNLVPIVIIGVLITVGLLKWEKAMIKGFSYFVFFHVVSLQIFIWRTRKAYFVLSYEACPATLYKTFRPFGVGRFIFISLLVYYNHVFFDGCRPLVFNLQWIL